MRFEKTFTLGSFIVVLVLNIVVLIFTYIYSDTILYVSIILTLIDSLYFTFKKTLILWLLIKVYKIKSGTYILNSKYVDEDEIFGDKIFSGEKRIQKDIVFKISVGLNKLKVKMFSDESSSSNYESIFTTYSIFKRKITYAYKNTAYDLSTSHEGIAVIDLRNKEISYSNHYPRLSKGNIILRKFN